MCNALSIPLFIAFSIYVSVVQAASASDAVEFLRKAEPGVRCDVAGVVFDAHFLHGPDPESVDASSRALPK